MSCRMIFNLKLKTGTMTHVCDGPTEGGFTLSVILATRCSSFTIMQHSYDIGSSAQLILLVDLLATRF